MAPALPLLGDLELAVLEHLWDCDETDVIHAHALVGAKRGISVNTVGSALERLYKKGLAKREKVSHAYRYRPALDRDAFRARRLMQAAGSLETLSRDGVLAAFVDLVADTDREALDELERLVQRRRKERAP
jgi:predicted transcriptional regulator